MNITPLSHQVTEHFGTGKNKNSLDSVSFGSGTDFFLFNRWNFADPETEKSSLAAAGYQTIFEEGGFLILKSSQAGKV